MSTNVAASRMVRTLENVWHAITTRHPEIPDVVVVLASGTDGKHPKWGHHAAHRWRVGDEDRAEVMVSGEGLRRAPHEVLGTLLHEATHVLADTRRIQDTSRQGRYHNKKFAVLARELGIEVEKDTTLGWSITSVPEATVKTYRAQVRALKTAMVLWRRNELAEAKTTRSSNLIAAICPCGRTIRIAGSALAEAPVVCGACGDDFEPKQS